MDKKKLAKNTAGALGFVGLAIAAPKLIPALALASKDYFGDIFSALFNDKDTEDSWGKIGVGVLSGILSNLGSSAAERIPQALSKEHNLHLETALAAAYLESFDTLFTSAKEAGDATLLEQSESFIPLLRSRIKRGLKGSDPSLLFPVQDKELSQNASTSQAFSNRLSGEDLILSLPDPDKMKTVIADDIEITLRRWVNEERAHQRGELGLGPGISLPEPLRSYLRDGLLLELPRCMGDIVQRDAFKKTWAAFQRAHLQAVLQTVKTLEGSHHALIKKIDGLSKLDDIVTGMAAHLSAYLSNTRLSEDDLDRLLQEYRADLVTLEGSLYRKIDDGIERLSKEGGEIERRLSDRMDVDKQEILKELRGDSRTLGDFWVDWAGATNPPLHYDLVIAGRKETRNQILAWLRNAPSVLTLQGDSVEESTAFITAVVQSLDENERETLLSRTVLVEDISSWRRLMQSTEPLILIARIDQPESIGQAVKNDHHVFVPLGRTGAAEGAFTLTRLVRDEAERALKIMGFSGARARDLATLARRSLSALRRKLAIAPGVQSPVWAQPNEARNLLAPLLAGVWYDSSEGDRDALSRLAGTPYEDIQRNAVRWANEPDPPLRKEGDVWMVAAREDAWRLIARYLTVDDLRRFDDVALDVLTERDPVFDLPTEKRYAASIYGKVLTRSGFLREAIAEALALMSTLSHDIMFAANMTGEDLAQRIVWKSLEKAKENKDLWASLSYLLPLLVEAAPNTFLDAIDLGLTGESPVLIGLFQDRTREATYFGSSPHVGLLWALETLAWSPEHLGRATLSLARLTRLDPGGHMGNRPSRSLWEIFVCWRPNTAAPVQRRIAVLDAIRKREPEVAWHLLVRLLPERHSTVSPTHGTRWRDWVPDPLTIATDQEYIEATDAILERLLSDAQFNASRWCDLIDSAGDLMPEQREVLLTRLDQLDPSLFSSEDQEKVHDCLRKEIERHQEFPDAEWAMPSQHVSRLEDVYNRFEPVDLIARHRWLFEQYVRVLGLRHSDWQKRTEVIEGLRTKALREILDALGWDGVLKLAEQAKEPGNVGFTLGRSDLLPIEPDEFLSKNLAVSEPWRGKLVRGFVSACVYKHSEPWIEERLAAALSGMWGPEQYGEFFLYLPLMPSIMVRLDHADDAAQRYFWKHINDVGLFEDADETDRMIARLLRFERPHTAVEAINWALHQNPELVSPERIAEVLEASIQTPPDIHFKASSFAHSSAELLNHLEKTDILRERLARLEWLYLKIHEHYRRPRILHDEMARNPEFFVEVLKYVYPTKSEPEQEVSEETSALARLAWELLDSWKQLPGRQDNIVDEETLKVWVRRVRELTAECDRHKIGDIHIGQAFAFSPFDPDGAWPHLVVRDLIEELASPIIESCWRTQVINNRGITTRLPTDGGEQEHALAARYDGYAEKISDLWPRTAAVLREIADNYRRHASKEDHQAELTQDFWR